MLCFFPGNLRFPAYSPETAQLIALQAAVLSGQLTVQDAARVNMQTQGHDTNMLDNLGRQLTPSVPESLPLRKRTPALYPIGSGPRNHGTARWRGPLLPLGVDRGRLPGAGQNLGTVVHSFQTQKCIRGMWLTGDAATKTSILGARSPIGGINP